MPTDRHHQSHSSCEEDAKAVIDPQHPAAQQVMSLLMRRYFIKTLHPDVRRRVKALKNLQVEHLRAEVEFNERLHSLEMEFAPKYEAVYLKRQNILHGLHEPTDQECDFPSDKEDEDEDADVEEQLSKELAEKAAVDNSESPKGVPKFWLHAMKHADILVDMIMPHDEPLLELLTDVRAKSCNPDHPHPSYPEKKEFGFVLEFEFADNEHFSNKVLTKLYTLNMGLDPEDPLSYEAAEIVACEGCKIEWMPGKNVTVEVIKKKQRSKGKGHVRFVTKTVKTDSFFNFFDPPVVKEGAEDEEDVTAELLSADFEIGHFIKERLIPRAVLYFCGEMIDNDDTDEYDEMEDDEEGTGDDDDEDDDDDMAEEEQQSHSRSHKRAGKDKSSRGAPPQECKQQ